MKSNKYLVFSLLLYPLLLAPRISVFLEASMVGQMLIQIPALALVGYWFGVWLQHKGVVLFKSYNQHGIPGILIVIFTSLFWIIPRMLDGSLNTTFLEIAKYTTIPIFLGIPLAWSWTRLNSVLKWFILVNTASMLFVMGWLYRNTELRICNNYLISQQQLLGSILFYSSIGLFLILVAFAFIGPVTNSEEP